MSQARPGEGVRGGPRRRTGPFLSPEMILDAASAVIEQDGPDALTFRRLGSDLRADHTAVLRHFGSKDELLLALANRLLEKALDGFSPFAHWRDTLADLARRVRSACLAHPGVAVLVAMRTSRRDAEFRAADIVIGALVEAGLPDREAASYYRVLADSALAAASYEASFLALDHSARQGDREAWRREYLMASPQKYPSLASVAQHLAGIDEQDQFETFLSLLLDAIAMRATREASSAQGY